MAFVQRLLSVTLSLQNAGATQSSPGTPQTFAGTGSNTITLNTPGTPAARQLRMSCHLSVKGGDSFSTASITIYGMTESEMAAASTYGQSPLINPGAVVTVMAGDAVSGMFQAFQGTIFNAWADYNAQPEVAFHVEANAGLAGAMTIVAPSSVKGPANAASILRSLAGQMGMNFENNSDIMAPIVNPYYRGSARDQVLAICKDCRIEKAFENGTLAIWPNNQERKFSTPGTEPTISYKNSTMIGYPTFFAAGIYAKALFNPGFRQGIIINVLSTKDNACGPWKIITLQHDLDANVPGGKWETLMQLSKIGVVTLPAS